MPWEGAADGAVARTSRSLVERDKEEARNETPGPGAYLKLDLSTATLRRGGNPDPNPNLALQRHKLDAVAALLWQLSAEGGGGARAV